MSFKFEYRAVCRFALASLTLGVLAACGGGGDAAGPTVTPSIAPTQVAITADNAQALAIGAMQVVEAARGVGSDRINADTKYLTGAVVPSKQKLAVANTVSLTTFPCSYGGTYTVTNNDGNGNGKLDAIGEGGAEEYVNCAPSQGENYNIRSDMVITAFNGATDKTLEWTLNGTSTAGADALSFAGKLQVKVLSSSEASVSTSGVTLSGTQGAVKWAATIKQLAGNVVVTTPPAPRVWYSTTTASATVSSSLFGDLAVDVSTPVAFVKDNQPGFPRAGTLLVKGDKNSSLKLEVLSTTQLKLSVDADGDGAYETSKIVLWTDFLF